MMTITGAHIMSYHNYAAIYSINLLVPNMRVARMFPVSLPVCVNSVVIGFGVLQVIPFLL